MPGTENESTSDETVMSEIKLFPNPAKDNLMITLSNINNLFIIYLMV